MLKFQWMTQRNLCVDSNCRVVTALSINFEEDASTTFKKEGLLRFIILILTGIAAGYVNSYYVHLDNGVGDDLY